MKFWLFSAAALLSSQMVFADLAQEARALRFLRGFETEVTETDVQSLGPNSDRILISIAENSSYSRVVRMRSILALGYSPTATARNFLQQILKRHGTVAEGADLLDVSAAISSLSSFGAATLPLLRPYLNHRAADVRQAAIGSVQRIGGAEAITMLRTHLATEHDSTIVRSIERALKTANIRP